MRKPIARGFTLVELMVVVAIFSVAAALALVSMDKANNASTDLDGMANAIRNAMATARLRAVATQQLYLVDVRANSVQWCQVPNAQTTACPSGTLEASGAMTFGKGASVVSWRQVDDRGQGNMPATLTPPAQVWLMPNGTADAIPTTPVPDGFTAYLLSADGGSKRKVVLYPAAARPRITDTWQ